MGNRDIIEICFRNLLRRRTRSILAVVGVIVGTCAIVVMLSLGFGLTDSYNKQLEQYGDLHMLSLYSNGAPIGSQSDKGVISDATLAKIAKIEGVTAYTPVVSEYLIFGLDKKIASAEVLGVKPELLEKFKFKVTDGRLLNTSDKSAILFGAQIPLSFADPNSNVWNPIKTDVLTDKIIMTNDWDYGRKNSSMGSGSDKSKFKEFKVKGVGVLEERNDRSSYSAYMNITEMEKIQKEIRRAQGQMVMPNATKTYDRALIYVEDLDYVEPVFNELKDMGYWMDSPLDWLSSTKETALMIQRVLGGIGGISLLVAALGIANTMIMSIYERTKEIGVMKVIGANLRDIRKMFLLEAGMIGFIGGMVGVGLSYLFSLLMNTVLKEAIGAALGNLNGGWGYNTDAMISMIPWWTSLAALAFATLIGVMAGYYPARRAMNLSALESLRNE